jgi:hypothetical protein
MSPVPDSERVRARWGPDKGPVRAQKAGTVPKAAVKSEKCSPGIRIPNGVVRMQPAQGFRFRYGV